MDILSLDQEVGAWDSVLLDPLNSETFIYNLHQRFKRDHIYVSLKKLIITNLLNLSEVNPQKKFLCLDIHRKFIGCY